MRHLIHHAFPAALLLLLLAACTDPRDGLVRYDDFVTDRAALSPPADPRAQLYCADETHWVRPLEAGEGLTFHLDLGRRPRLVLTYCRPDDGRGSLAVTAVADGAAAAVSVSAGIEGLPRWQRWEVDLAPLAGRASTITLSLDLPPGRRLLLRDAYVRHLDAAAAGWPRGGVHVEADEAAGEETEVLAGSPAAVPAAALAAATANATETATDGVAAAAGRRRGPGSQILLVSVDTLRRDHVGAFGGGPAVRSPTPHLDALAADGEVFDPHYAGASWTKPSHASMLTGYPFWVHGAGGIEGVLDPGVPTLAERLRAAGLATGGLVHDCVWLNPKFGLHRGFDDYRSVKWRSGQLARAAVNWMAAHRGEPFFFFLHTFDAHSDFRHLPYEGAGANAGTVGELFGVPGYGCREQRCASGLLSGLQEREVEPLPNEPQILRYLYGAGVAEVDVHLGRLFDDLRRLGLYDELTIVLTSDHGEMLLEHGNALHGLWWQEVLRVPLVVKWANGERAGTRTSTPTSALDLAVTLAAVAGVDAPGLPGVDLRRPRADRVLVAGEPSWQAIYRGDSKGVVFAENESRRFLFDLAADPGEGNNLRRERPERMAELEADLAAIHRWAEETRRRLGRGGAAAAGRLSAEEQERLRALGYLQ